MSSLATCVLMPLIVHYLVSFSVSLKTLKFLSMTETSKSLKLKVYSSVILKVIALILP
jgi:hypothetical protein